MIKPQDYDETKAYGEFTPFAPGGHFMTIVKVEECKSSTGSPMLKIGLDADSRDAQAGYYMDQFNNDTRTGKKWGCMYYQLIYDNDGHCNRGLKTFLEAVEQSNPGFNVVWGEGFCKALAKKAVGGVFRREQYIGNDGKAHWSVKCIRLCPVSSIEDGVPVPEDKLLDGAGVVLTETTSTEGLVPPPAGGYYPLDSESDIPF